MQEAGGGLTSEAPGNQEERERARRSTWAGYRGSSPATPEAEAGAQGLPVLQSLNALLAQTWDTLRLETVGVGRQGPPVLLAPTPWGQLGREWVIMWENFLGS